MATVFQRDGTSVWYCSYKTNEGNWVKTTTRLKDKAPVSKPAIHLKIVLVFDTKI